MRDIIQVQYLCQRILLLRREVYVPEEQGVVLEEDKIRRIFFLVKGHRGFGPWRGSRRLPCTVVVEFQQNRKG